MEWIATFEALNNVFHDGAFSNIAINDALERHRNCSSSFVRTFTKGVIRDSIRLDYIVDQLANKGLKGIKNRTLIVIKMGIYAIDSLDSVPEYAAVNEAVKLSRKVAKGQDSFINAVLRNYIRSRASIVIPDDWAIKYSFSEDIVRMIVEQYGDDSLSIIKALNQPSSLVLRTNLLKNSREALIASFSDNGIDSYPVKDSNLAVVAETGNVIGTDAYNNGLFTVQSLSSIIAIEAMKPEPGSTVLDMCAAPGGKTTAIAELMNNSGTIIACDVYDHRLELIRLNAERLGISCISTLKLDGTIHHKDFESKFDYVLADVPCSGIGVIPSKPEIKLKELNDIKELTDIQINILDNAIQYTKPGGLIEYSTCTINKNENEGVINTILDRYSSLEIIEKQSIMPYNNLIGFFYCIIKKNTCD